MLLRDAVPGRVADDDLSAGRGLGAVEGVGLNMNRMRQGLLVCAMGAIILMGLFPPWSFTRPVATTHVGYYAIWSTPYASKPGSQAGILDTFDWEMKKPAWSRPWSANNVNVSLLATQWLGVCLVTAALWAFFKDPADHPPQIRHLRHPSKPAAHSFLLPMWSGRYGARRMICALGIACSPSRLDQPGHADAGRAEDLPWALLAIRRKATRVHRTHRPGVLGPECRAAESLQFLIAKDLRLCRYCLPALERSRWTLLLLTG